MARQKVRTSMSFRVEIHPMDAAGNDIDIPPTCATFGPAFATQWHEKHLDLAVRTLINDTIDRVDRR